MGTLDESGSHHREDLSLLSKRRKTTRKTDDDMDNSAFSKRGTRVVRLDATNLEKSISGLSRCPQPYSCDENRRQRKTRGPGPVPSEWEFGLHRNLVTERRDARERPGIMAYSTVVVIP
jgi:hypothetical protein